MGCGGSTQVSQDLALADKQYLKSVAKLQGRKSSVCIEEARKRREECAKHRVRRASVMAQLEAEKLTQRKRSNASMYNNSVSDISTEVNVPQFVPSMAREVKGAPQESDITEGNAAVKEKGEESWREPSKTKIRITFSTDSRPGSSTIANGDDEALGTIFQPLADAIIVKENDEELLQSNAKTIVEKAVTDAIDQVNFKVTYRDVVPKS